jgi:hypothetical protein
LHFDPYGQITFPFKSVQRVRLAGFSFTLKEAARRLRDGGRVIVVSTGGTKMFFPDQSLNLGSKGAVEQFVRCLSYIADVAVLLASDAGRWVTGHNIGAGRSVLICRLEKAWPPIEAT